MSTTSTTDRLRDRLGRETRAEVYFDRGMRGIYSTDASLYQLDRIGVVDRDAMTVRVEPGVVLDRLNAHLRPLGLMFGPDVSTSDRATIGGMIGNNSAGARSLRYGKT